MFSIISKSLSQIFDPSFRRILYKAIGFTVLLLIAVWIAGLMLFQLIPSFSFTIFGYEVSFFDELAYGFAVSALIGASVFLMFPVAALFLGFLLEDICKAVEKRHYPELPPARKQPFNEVLWSSVSFMLTLIVVNICLLPFYFITTIFSPFLFVAANGYLLGREYFEVVAFRRMEPANGTRMRKRHMLRIWIMGMAIAAPLSVPFVNLLMPLVGVAAFTHLFQRIRQQ